MGESESTSTLNMKNKLNNDPELTTIKSATSSSAGRSNKQNYSKIIKKYFCCFRKQHFYWSIFTTNFKLTRIGKTHKLSTGLGIVYGMFLFSIGVFLSLDSMAGELGKYRVVNTVSVEFTSFAYISK